MVTALTKLVNNTIKIFQEILKFYILFLTVKYLWMFKISDLSTEL